MSRLKEVSELEPLVADEKNLIKLDRGAGLKLFEQQLSLGDAGRSDILATDKRGALCVIELKTVPADARAVAQLLRYLDFFKRSRKPLAEASDGKLNPELDVQLYLVAEEFDEDARRLRYYLKLPLKLIRYKVSVPRGASRKRGISFEPVSVANSDLREVKTFLGRKEIVGRIANPSVRRDFRHAMRVLEDTCKLKALPYLREGRNAFEFRCYPYRTGDDVAYLTSYPNHFVGWWWDPKKRDFRQSKCKTFNEWQCKVLPKILAAIE